MAWLWKESDETLEHYLAYLESSLGVCDDEEAAGIVAEIKKVEEAINGTP